MAGWHRVAAVGEVPAGSARELTVAGRVIALYNVDGTLYALDGICPHLGGPLGEGTLEGPVVTCPWHGWQFDVTTGRNCLSPRIEQSRFPLKVEGNDVFVELPDQQLGG
ncbi:MAG TPA: Rieske 2Fe-2S domain-containing protein [Planctomycetaceae bacterium]|jgi:nitrite reductase (NADH) small subunit|nr:Rieske 2Fe-2S domain-containing protein [Planctomycetaceae bacterium]